MGVTPAKSTPAPDDLAVEIESAQVMLREAGQSTVMRRDPYRVVLGGMSAVLGVFGKSVVRWERAVADVIAARDPMPASEREALVAELVASTRAGAEAGAYEGMRKEARRMVRSLDVALAVRVGAAVGFAFVCGAGAMSLVWYARASGPFDRSAQAGEFWQAIVRDNPDPRSAFDRAEIRVDQAAGRPYYACVSLWRGPSRPPPASPAKP